MDSSFSFIYMCNIKKLDGELEVSTEAIFKKIGMAGLDLQMLGMQTDLFQRKEGDYVRF